MTNKYMCKNKRDRLKVALSIISGRELPRGTSVWEEILEEDDYNIWKLGHDGNSEDIKKWAEDIVFDAIANGIGD